VADATATAHIVALEQRRQDSELLGYVHDAASAIAAEVTLARQGQEREQEQEQPSQQQPAGAVRVTRPCLPSYAKNAVRALGAERRRLTGINVGLPSKMAPQPSNACRSVHFWTTTMRLIYRTVRNASPDDLTDDEIWADLLPASASIRRFAHHFATDGEKACVLVKRREGHPSSKQAKERTLTRKYADIRRAAEMKRARRAIVKALPQGQGLGDLLRDTPPTDITRWSFLRELVGQLQQQGQQQPGRQGHQQQMPPPPQPPPPQGQPRGVRIVAIDPGTKAMFTAVTPSDPSFRLPGAHGSGAYTPPERAGDFGKWLASRTYHVITSDWRTMVGITRQARWLERHKRRYSADVAVMTALRGRDTHSVSEFAEYCCASARLRGGAARRLYVTRRHRVYGLRHHGLEERALQHITQELFWGYTCVRGRHRSPRPLPPAADQVAETVVVAVGSAYGGISRGAISGPHPPITRALDWIRANRAAIERPARAPRVAQPAQPVCARPERVFLIMVDEHYTSRACNRWCSGLPTMEEHRYRCNKRVTWAVKRCEWCGVVVDRDMLAAINICVRLLAELLYTGEPDPRLMVFGKEFFDRCFGG
jgi:hypothetical protein